MSKIKLATTQLLEPGSIDEDVINRAISRMMSSGMDYADLYFQQSHHEFWSLEDGVVKDGSYDIDSGVGVRAVHGEKSGFAYSDDISVNALLQAADSARVISRSGSTGKVYVPVKSSQPKLSGAHELYASINPLLTVAADEKVALLRDLDRWARAIDPKVSQVIASVAGAYETILIAASDGTFAADVRPLVRVNVSVIVEHNGRRENGSCGFGGRSDFSLLLDQDKAKQSAEEAVRQALVNLEAEDAPAGTMEVVLGNGWPGVLLHEAVGHGLEGDFNRKKTSAFSGRIGENVASSLCTVVDNGTLEGRRGSLNIDDEGTPTENTTLIENGVLKGYMQDKSNAHLMGVESTGNGRRESYAHLPLPRMTNTYMLPGESDPQEIIESVKNGIYAVNFGGGQVDITSGKFVFSANEAYLIENGKVKQPLRGVTLIGNGPEVMSKITMVGNDLELDRGVGVCGKEGQSVPVGVGQPTLKVRELTVGGTEE
ncbi:MAG: metalloprotease TldD [Thiotrichales bacterium]|nr:metalloprotease TldD [Thiotrichales bacterium]